MNLHERIESALGARPRALSALSGGSVASVWLATMPDGTRVVAKHDDGPGASMDVEGAMLDALRARSDLPLPRVLHREPAVLLLEWIEHDGSGAREAELHAADLLAALHGTRPGSPNRARFGFEHDTLIGPLVQPNPWCDTWAEFFGEHRLMHFARACVDAGELPNETLGRFDRLVGSLNRHVTEPEHPSLVHGDVWGGNVLIRCGRVAAFIDPAVHYAHAEVELAFIRLFGCFGDRFFCRYHEHRPIPDGFERRCVVHQLYPLLVHTRLFGGGYASQVRGVLDRLGV